MSVRVAFIVGQLSLGGAEQQLYYLLSGLDRARFIPLVITLGPACHEYWKGPIEELRIPVLHVSRRCGRVLRVLRIAAILRARAIQMIHSWDLHTNPYSALAARMSGVRVRIGSMRLNYDGIPGGKLMQWAGYRGLDVLITNSATAARQVKELQLTTANVCLVCNGVPSAEPVSAVDRVQLKLELGFSDSDILIGSIGRMDANKNHVMLLRCFALLSKQWERLRLIIIGEGPLKPQLVAMAKRLDIASKVSFPGAIPRAARYLPALDVCCLTSYTEGMPNLIMEASAAGVPVLSTRCGDTPELIMDGISGYLVSPDDDLSMANHLSSLLTSAEQRRCMGEAARERMRRDFGIQSMVTQMTRVYEESLAAKGLN
jgi:glycosyltransferase involved in cell wall biosynthesis